ncbi:unnamed protein product [Oikopleura dioica]|uniref:OB domain-containing protein n=1 Tax=Oikopleura dioica TaxID=34765 RepID=E4Y0J8_OIKDI|nr:unnamed protein product [Oikopleura dioica]
MAENKMLQNYVHVTLANLNKPDSFFTSDVGNGFLIYGWQIAMGAAVFCGKVLGTKEIEKNESSALGICLDDGTGIHVFNDVIRVTNVKKGDYIKIFGAIKPNKNSLLAFVLVHVIQPIKENPASVLSCFMLEAIQTVALVMGNGKAAEDKEITEDEYPVLKRDGVNATACRVLSIVLNNKSEEGAKCPADFKTTGLKEEEIMKILNELMDHGRDKSTHKFINIKLKGMSTAPSTIIISKRPKMKQHTVM